MSAAFTQYIDVAQVVLYLFWAFLAGIIIYLHREDKREGYPLESSAPATSPCRAGLRCPPPRLSPRRRLHGLCAARRAP